MDYAWHSAWTMLGTAHKSQHADSHMWESRAHREEQCASEGPMAIIEQLP